MTKQSAAKTQTTPAPRTLKSPSANQSVKVTVQAPGQPTTSHTVVLNPTAPAAPVAAAPAAPATTVAAPVATLHSAAPAQPQWQAKPKYAATIAKATALPAAMGGEVLVAVTEVTCRPNTARAAAYAALVRSVGQPKEVVTKAVAEAEKSWHMAQGRTPTNVSPVGWFRTFDAKFGAK